MADSFEVRTEVAVVAAFFLEMDRRSTSEASSVHPAHEFIAGPGSIDIHGNRLRCWGSKWVVQKRGRCSHCFGHHARTFLLPILLSVTLANLNINIGGNGYQLVKSANGASGMNKLVLDAS